VRGQKSVDNQRSKTKIKTSKKYFLNFSLGSTELIILEFLTPHGSKIATSVAILSPLFAKNSRLGYFLNAKSP